MPRDTYANAVLDIEPHTQRQSSGVIPDEPFTILVLGAFSGAAVKDGGTPVEIDLDNFDAVVNRFAPQLKMNRAGAPFRLEFRNLDDFHPDALHGRVSLFRDIERAVTGGSETAAARPNGNGGSGGLLDRILDDLPAGSGAASSSAPDPQDLRAFIDRALASYLIPAESQEETSRRSRIRAVTTELMRAILHSPEYQKLEALWRGVWFLVRRIDSGANVKVFIAQSDDGDEIPSAPGELKWSVVLVNRTFDHSEKSVNALSRFGRQAMLWNAALLAEAEAPVDDDASRAEWSRFRTAPEAAHIGLALPRLIARMPYGESGETTDEFPFEEMRSVPLHNDYLWMNPAFGMAYLLAASFVRGGWNMVPGSVRELEGMPLHVYREEGEPVAKPCAELLLHETDVEQLLDAGIMPLASIRDTDRVRLVRFQSIAEPARSLAGPWD
jgi:type VI secretion system protein ImpC